MPSTIQTASLPDLTSRYASASFGSVAIGDTFTLGSVIYTFVAAIGAPAANNVEVVVQGTIQDSVIMLARAIRGETDLLNIAYGAGTQPNPDCTAYWTSLRFSIGSTVVPAGQNLHITELADNSNAPITLAASNVSVSINAFTRQGFARYILDGNHTTDSQQSVRGSLQTIFPIGSVVLNDTGVTSPYFVENVSLIDLTMNHSEIVEMDFYQSADEVNFTIVSKGMNTMGKSGRILEIPINSAIVLAGNGLYMRVGTNGIGPSKYMDVQVCYAI